MNDFTIHVQLACAARTDPGRVRQRNEDAVAIDGARGLAVLADGMGGYNAGDVASRLAVETFLSSMGRRMEGLPPAPGRRLRQAMFDAIADANRVVYEASLREAGCSGMGTTIVAASFHHDRAVIAHAGDSRLYRWRDGVLTLLTRDHSYTQEQVDAGLMLPEEARLSPHRNLITRALGVEDSIDPEIHECETAVGDVYLLCSDGLSDMLVDEEIAAVMAGLHNDTGRACNALVDMANEMGGRDNISAVLIGIDAAEPLAERSLLKRLFRTG